MTKKEKLAKEEKSQRRQERIRINEDLIRKEEAEREKQRRVMDEKSKLYERMKNGEEVVYDDGSRAEFLVNFHMKKRELEDKDSDSDSDNKDRKERLPTPPLIQHYDHSEEKGRIFGPSHAPLPQNEEERLKKIKELKEMSKQTDDVRKRRKKQLGDKKRAEREKLKKFRAKHNLSPLESTSEESEEEEPSTSIDNKASPEPEEKKIRLGIREWDTEKLGYNKWIQKERDERDSDFRPPSSYFRK